LRWRSRCCQILTGEGLLIEMAEMDGDTISDGTQLIDVIGGKCLII
jgi:hypothetical protein